MSAVAQQAWRRLTGRAEYRPMRRLGTLGPMTSAREEGARDAGEAALAARVAAGDAAAIDRFLDLAGAPIWTAVVRLEGEGAAAEAAYLKVLDALRADDWQRLKAFDGRASLATWLALFARRVLIEALPQALAAAPDAGWRRFERIFGRDIRRRVARRFPRADQTVHDDLFQEVCVGLVEDGYRRLLAFGGTGSFEGFVLTLIDRLLIDLLRKEAPRRRLPAEVERMSGLDQAVFIQAAWKGAPMEPARLLERLGGHAPELDLFTVAASLQRVRGAVEAERTRRSFGRTASIDESPEQGGIGDTLASNDPDPEDELIRRQAEGGQSALIGAIVAAAEAWPDDERVYLKTFLGSGAPPREIARMMARPIEAVRQIQQRVQRRMTQIAKAMNITAASVYGAEE
jgi:RNA polymerase primary sigma factor